SANPPAQLVLKMFLPVVLRLLQGRARRKRLRIRVCAEGYQPYPLPGKTRQRLSGRQRTPFYWAFWAVDCTMAPAIPSLPLKLTDGGRQCGVFGPRQVRHIAEAAAREHDAIHAAVLMVGRHPAHAPALVE